MKRRRLEEELDRDIQGHLELETQDNIERGMSPEEARHAALRKFGNVARIKESQHEMFPLRSHRKKSLDLLDAEKPLARLFLDVRHREFPGRVLGDEVLVDRVFEARLQSEEYRAGRFNNSRRPIAKCHRRSAASGAFCSHGDCQGQPARSRSPARELIQAAPGVLRGNRPGP